jgi:hypothetical protein
MLPLKVSPFGTIDDLGLFCNNKNPGAARLSYPDPAAPEYNRLFVRAANREALKHAAACPDTLVIPCSGAINIFVDSVQDLVRIYGHFHFIYFTPDHCYRSLSLLWDHQTAPSSNHQQSASGAQHQNFTPLSILVQKRRPLIVWTGSL